MKTGVIYALCDPDTGEIRYVGKTVARYWRTYCAGHYRAAQVGGTMYKHRWLRTLSGPPEVRLLERVELEQLGEAEIRWIAQLRSEGARLTNLTEGGDGCLGRTHEVSDDARAKIAAARRGSRHSDQSKARMRATHQGEVRSPETRAKIAAGLRGKPRTTAHRAALSAAASTPEARARSSAVHRGKVVSDESRRRMREAAKRRWARARDELPAK